MNQWQVAALRPPYLRAIGVWEGCSDFYREFTRHGGILSLFSDLWFNKYVLPVQHGLGARGWASHILEGEWVTGPETFDEVTVATNLVDWRRKIREHRFANEPYWRSRLPDFSQINVPLLSAANWGGQGLHLRGNVEGFIEAGTDQKWLDFHCYEHWTEYYTNTGIALQKQFFGHFLRDEDNGWNHRQRVHLLVRRPGAPFESRGDDQWPLKDTRWVKFHLHADGALRADQPVAATSSISYEATGDGLTFITEPLAEECHVIGPSAARLRISASTADADLFLVLRLFTPDLKEVTYAGSNDPHTPMSHGWLRASMRKLDTERSLPYRPYHTMDECQPLAPGQTCDLDVEIFPTCFVAPKGYRIALSIRGKDYEYPGDLSAMTAAIGQPFTGVGPFRHTCPEDRPAEVFNNRVTLHFDPADPPLLVLPVVPPA
jgi:hypothetical protein